MMRSRLSLTAALAFGLSAAAAADPLAMGSPAPALRIDTWVKGDPVDGIAKGKVYVVEFWGTACGPCIKCMPHLTELQRKHPDVTFVALSDEPEADVRDFVAKHDNDMGFRVGHDAGGRMWKAWMAAADLRGTPTAFVVGRAGQVAWVGHPDQIDEPLRQLLDGTFDPQLDVLRLRLRAAAGKQQQVENDRLDRHNAVAVEVEELTGQRKWDAALAAVEAAGDPKVDQGALRFLKVSVLAGNPVKADEAIQAAIDLAATTRNTGGFDSTAHSRSYYHLAGNLRSGFVTSPDPRLADLAITRTREGPPQGGREENESPPFGMTAGREAVAREPTFRGGCRRRRTRPGRAVRVRSAGVLPCRPVVRFPRINCRGGRPAAAGPRHRPAAISREPHNSSSCGP